MSLKHILLFLSWTSSAYAFTSIATPSATHTSSSGPSSRCLHATPSSVDAPAEASRLKTELLRKIDLLRCIKAMDGDVSVDFGVKGGELNATTRAPQQVDFFQISDAAGETSLDILNLCDQLAAFNPTSKPTEYLGSETNGEKAPLHGPWKLLFTTAADASFSKNSTRGDAMVSNVVDACRGSMANIIDFVPKDGKRPFLQQLKVMIAAKAINDQRVALRFRYAKVTFGRFWKLPFRWSLYIPVPGPFITRLLVLAGRIFRFRKSKGTKIEKPPQAYFDVLYVDDDMRVHKTGEDNVFVQARPTWAAAKGLFD